MRAKIIVFGIVLLLSVSVSMASALSNAGGGEWRYYKEITVHENSGKTLNDFQVLVELNAANFDFSKAKADGSDIRFECDGKELSYWIEEWDSYAKRAKIWVKVQSIPANGEVKMKMYYGNPYASAVSNGDATFEFFDDFDSETLGTKWQRNDGSSMQDTEDNYCYIDSANSVAVIDSVTWEALTTKTFYATRPIIIETKAKQTVNFGSYAMGIQFYDPATSINFNDYSYHIFTDGTYIKARIAPGRPETDYTGDIVNLNLNNYYIVRMELTSTDVIGRVYDLNRNLIGSISVADRSHKNKKVGLDNFVDSTAGEKCYFDWFLVRKYASPEPTVIVGAEYEIPHVSLNLRKEVKPYSIKQGQKTTVILTVENTGTTTLRDIEISDTPPAEFDFVSGETYAKYGILKPGESRTFSYVIKSRNAGRFDLGTAKVTYADEEGNYHTVESNSPMLEVLAPIATPEIPTGEEKRIPGFEHAFVAAVLSVAAYLLRRR